MALLGRGKGRDGDTVLGRSPKPRKHPYAICTPIGEPGVPGPGLCPPRRSKCRRAALALRGPVEGCREPAMSPVVSQPSAQRNPLPPIPAKAASCASLRNLRPRPRMPASAPAVSRLIPQMFVKGENLSAAMLRIRLPRASASSNASRTRRARRRTDAARSWSSSEAASLQIRGHERPGVT
jgi:hypothetical protein